MKNCGREAARQMMCEWNLKSNAKDFNQNVGY